MKFQPGPETILQAFPIYIIQFGFIVHWILQNISKWHLSNFAISGLWICESVCVPLILAFSPTSHHLLPAASGYQPTVTPTRPSQLVRP